MGFAGIPRCNQGAQWLLSKFIDLDKVNNYYSTIFIKRYAEEIVCESANAIIETITRVGFMY
jgi:hypothetical protein